MKVGIDVDGVLANFNDGFIDYLVSVLNKDLFPTRPFDIETWDYPQSYGYTEEEVNEVWRHIKADLNFWGQLKPYADTQNFLSFLYHWQGIRNDVYFITARLGLAAKVQTEQWLNRYGFPKATVLISPHKGDAAAILDLDVYIDDRDKNVYNVLQSRREQTNVYLRDQPWNRGVRYPGLHRIYTLEHFAKEIYRMDDLIAAARAV